MSYSSVAKKYCKCSPTCLMYPTFGFAGFYAPHSPKLVADAKKSRNKKATVARNKRLRTKVRKLQSQGNDEAVELQLWYQERRKEMTGYCLECAKSTNKRSDRYYRWSICHIVPKSLLKSVATHADNWLELCQDHHNRYDSNFEAASKMKCFELARIKFDAFRYHIVPSEFRKINPYLL